VRVEFRPARKGEVLAGKFRGRLWLVVPASPSGILSDDAVLGEAVEKAVEAWMSPLSGPGTYIASSIILGVLGLVLGKLAAQGTIEAVMAALLWAVLALIEGARTLFKKRRSAPGETEWVESIIKASAEAAVACMESRKCAGVYPVMGVIFEYKVDEIDKAILVSMHKRSPYM
jgi:hypothetical protein